MTSRLSWVLALALFALAACSGGDGLPDFIEQPILLRIIAAGVITPVWSGANVLSPACATGVPENSEIIFEFAGAVSPSSVPASNALGGAITLVDDFGAFPTGTFALEDRPDLPSGNRRRIRFRPSLTYASTITSSFGVARTIRVVVQEASLTVASAPLRGGADTCFQICVLGQTQCLADVVPGAPFVVATNPPSADTPTPGVVAGPTATDDIVSVFFNEAMRIVGPVGPDLVRLVSESTGATIPGTLIFFPAGSAEAGLQGARVDFRPLLPLSPGRIHRIEVGSSLVDFGGQPATLYDPALTIPGGPRRRFATDPGTPLALTVLDENFTTTTNRESVTGLALWEGNGQVGVRNAVDVFGDGAFGALIVMPGQTVTLDTGMPPLLGGGGALAFENGVWNVTELDIQAGGVLRLTGSRPAHFRCLGMANILGRIEAGAGLGMGLPPGSPNQGPGVGQFNNGTPNLALAEVLGGVGGPGGGRGGRASVEPGRAATGEAGEGATIDGMTNLGPAGANPLFGGGGGGAGGFLFPTGGSEGDLGGLGGAGGSAFQSGGNPVRRTTLASGCAPVTTLPNSPIAQATGALVSLSPPISILGGGSGGGGGGDRFDTSSAVGMFDEQGGGGGGGGGGIRITAVSPIVVGAGGQILANGATGGLGNVLFGGAGGSGSGGLIWLQSATVVDVSASALVSAVGGSVVQMCSAAANGEGGAGLIQLEDEDGIIATNFFGPIAGAANVATLPSPFPGAFIMGAGHSRWLDSGSPEPDYTSVVVEQLLATAPGSTATVELQGARPVFDGSAVDSNTLTAWFPSANVDALDGYRFVRFRVNLGYTGSPLPALGAVLPAVTRVAILANSF